MSSAVFVAENILPSRRRFGVVRRGTPFVVASLLAFCILVASSASADLCSLGPSPAATLLLPYFEVDLGGGEGVNTLFSIHNSEPRAALAHVTVWTDWAVPVLSFDVFLTGYDVVTVDLHNVLANGNLPITADAQSDPADTISPHGAEPEWDDSFPMCEQIFPFLINPMITEAMLDRVQNGLSGYPDSEGGGCMGEARNGAGSCVQGACPPGTIARGFITVDSVDECSVLFPSDPGYFSAENGVADSGNLLWGDYFFLESSTGDGLMFPLVHLEADAAFHAETVLPEPSAPPNPNNITFYGRYTQAMGGIDHREPVAKAWATRYFDNVAAQETSSFHVWRDPTLNTAESLFPCGVGEGSGPAWNPLPSVEVTCFDESENVVTLCETEACFPTAAQRVEVSDLGLPFTGGWCFLNLGIPADAFPGDVDFPAAGGPLAQSFVNVAYRLDNMYYGSYSAGLEATELASACTIGDPRVLPAVEIFAGGFEIGDGSAWSRIFGGS